jgi:DNA-directed RNA polymerase III subunit RPC4
MTASGPFAMGPALAGQSGRRSIPRSNFTPIVPSGSGSSSHGAGLSGTRAPTLKKDKEDEVSAKINEQDEYSDPDEGVEIVDMENIRQMDWAAPESLHRDRNEGRKKKAIRIKKEVSAEGTRNFFLLRPELM